MPLDIFHRNDIRNQIEAGLSIGLDLTMQKEPVNMGLVIGLLLAFRHQAQAAGLVWQGAITTQDGRVTLGLIDEYVATLEYDAATKILAATQALRDGSWRALIE